MNTLPIQINCNSDKSASIRMILYSIIACDHNPWGQKIIIKNIDISDDAKAALNALDALKIRYKLYDDHDESELVITMDKIYKDHAVYIDCLNSGTTFRLLCGILPGMEIEGFLTGDTSLMSRPHERVLEPLTKAGCKFKLDNNRLAIFKRKRKLKNIEYIDNIGSAQVHGALTLFAKLANIELNYQTNFNFRQTTNIILNEMFETNSFVLKQYEFDMDNFKDPSSAIFFFLKSLLDQKSIIINDILWDQTRIKYFDYFQNNIEYLDNKAIIFHPERPLKNVSAEEYSAIIDELPTLMVSLALFGEDKTYKFSNILELQNKESNRLQKVIEILDILNAQPTFNQETATLTFTKGQLTTNINFDCVQDHRISMLCEILRWNVEDYSSVSFPNFFHELYKF